jgi:hypothetical protein
MGMGSRSETLRFNDLFNLSFPEEGKMRAPCLVVSSRKIAGCLLTLLLLVSVAAAKTNRATIGSLTYLGTGEFGSAFRVTLDPSLVTSQSLSFTNVTLFVDGTSQSSGRVTTPVSLLFIGGTVDGVVHPLASCASGCVSIAVQLGSATGESFSFSLLDGQEFPTFSVTTAAIKPLPGQKFIQAQQSVPIVLKRNASGK